jgi:iron(III) transport system substrate-binding protein
MSRKRVQPSAPHRGVTRRGFLQATGAVAGAAALGTGLPRGASAQEGMVWYSGSSARSVAAWAEMFQNQSGIPTEHFRSGGVKLAQKFEAEVKAGQVRCSALDSSLPGIMMDWVDRGLMTEYESPEASNYPNDVRAPGYWAPIKALVLTISYNADLIKPEEAPRTWEDVLDPKWKGKMVMADAFYSGAALHWYGAMRKAFGKSFMEKLSKQDVLIRRGSGATANTMVSGERPLSPMMLHYRVFAAIKKGANLQVVMPDDGVPVSYMVIGVPKAAPNPEAGKKFVDFALSQEAQTFWQSNYHTPSLRTDVEPLSRERGRGPLSELKRIYSTRADMRAFFGQQQALMDEWNTLFK